jgi:hypothetical protein
MKKDQFLEGGALLFFWIIEAVDQYFWSIWKTIRPV